MANYVESHYCWRKRASPFYNNNKKKGGKNRQACSVEYRRRGRESLHRADRGRVCVATRVVDRGGAGRRVELPLWGLTRCHVTHANRHLSLSYKQCDRAQREFSPWNRGFPSVFEWFTREEMSDAKTETKSDNNIEDASKVSRPAGTSETPSSSRVFMPWAACARRQCAPLPRECRGRGDASFRAYSRGPLGRRRRPGCRIRAYAVRCVARRYDAVAPCGASAPWRRAPPTDRPVACPPILPACLLFFLSSSEKFFVTAPCVRTHIISCRQQRWWMFFFYRADSCDRGRIARSTL